MALPFRLPDARSHRAKTLVAPPPRQSVAPPAVGSPQWFASASSGDVAAFLASLSPDYSSVNTAIDVPGLTRAADEQATRLFDEATKGYRDIRTENLGREKISHDAATNFTAALASIFTGGKPGAEGEAYSKEQFGGSYMGAIAAQQGAELHRQITHDFGIRDTQLGEKIADVMAQKPEVRQQIMDDLLKGETERIEQGIALADSAYEHRVKALGALIAQRRHEETLTERSENNRLDNYTRVLIATMKRNGVTARQLTRADGSKALIDAQTGRVIQELSPARAAKAPAVKTYRDPATGVTYRIDPQTGEYLPTGKTPVAAKPPAAGATGSRTKFFGDQRKGAFAQAKDLWSAKTRPAKVDAKRALWEEFGQPLLARGFKRKTIEQMIMRALSAASAGATWTKRDADESGSGGSGGFDWGA